MIRPIALAAFAVSCFFAAPLRAQTCLGFPSYGNGKLALTASMAADNVATSLAAELNAGMTLGTFLGVSVGRTEFDSSPLDATSIGGHVGYGLQSQPGSTFTMCPIARITRTFGPDFSLAGVETETNSLQLSGGLSAGAELPMSPDVTGIPFVGANFLHFRRTETTAGVESSVTENYFTIVAGFGLSFGRTLTITPSGVVPIGLEGADSMFVLAVRLNFGNR